MGDDSGQSHAQGPSFIDTLQRQPPGQGGEDSSRGAPIQQPRRDEPAGSPPALVSGSLGSPLASGLGLEGPPTSPHRLQPLQGLPPLRGQESLDRQDSREPGHDHHHKHKHKHHHKHHHKHREGGEGSEEAGQAEGGGKEADDTPAQTHMSAPPSAPPSSVLEATLRLPSDQTESVQAAPTTVAVPRLSTGPPPAQPSAPPSGPSSARGSAPPSAPSSARGSASDSRPSEVKPAPVPPPSFTPQASLPSRASSAAVSALSASGRTAGSAPVSPEGAVIKNPLLATGGSDRRSISATAAGGDKGGEPAVRVMVTDVGKRKSGVALTTNPRPSSPEPRSTAMSTSAASANTRCSASEAQARGSGTGGERRAKPKGFFGSVLGAFQGAVSRLDKMLDEMDPMHVEHVKTASRASGGASPNPSAMEEGAELSASDEWDSRNSRGDSRASESRGQREHSVSVSESTNSGAPLRNRPSQVGSSARSVGRPDSTAAQIRQSQMNAKGSRGGSTMAARAPYTKPAPPKSRMQKLAAAFTLYLQARRKAFRRLSPRDKMAMLFIFSEAVLCVGFAITLLVLRHSIEQLDLATATQEVKLLDLTYQIKINQLGFGMRGQSQNAAIISYLQDRSPARYSAVRTILRNEMSTRRLEFVSLLSVNGTVLVNAGSKNRSLEAFDPSGVVSKMCRLPKAGQIRTSKLISWPELASEGITVYRERVKDVQPTDFNHPFDQQTRHNAIRWVAQPVFSMDSSATFLGVLLAGDVVNGKTPICFHALDALGSGLTAIFAYDKAQAPQPKAFQRACLLAAIMDPASQGSGEQRVLSASADPVPRSMLLQAAEAPSSSVIVSDHDKYFVYAAKRFNNGVQNLIPQASEVSPVVAVRGVRIDASGMFQKVFRVDMILLAVIVGVNMVAFYLTMAFFMIPLERLANRLKAKEKVDMKEVGKMRMGRRYMMSVCVTLTTSIVCIALSGIFTTRAIVQSIFLDAASNVGVAKVSYGIKMDQMSLGMRGQSDNAAIRTLLDNPSSIYWQNQTRVILRAEVTNRRIEVATLFDATKTIVVGANVNRTGEDGWDPAGLVSLTLSTGLRYKATALLSYDELLAEGPPRWQEKQQASTPNSALSPYTTRKTALIRYTSTPVYSASDVSRASVDGVLISGDIVDGKSILSERLLSVLDVGYAAYYVYDPETTPHYRVVSSAFRNTSNGPIQVDVPLPSSVHALLDSLRLDTHDMARVANAELEMQGLSLVLAARRVQVDRYVTDSGDRETQGGGQAVGFMVYGNLRSETAKLEHRMLLTTLLCALLQLATTLYMNYYSYSPLRKLLDVMQRRGFISKRNKGGSFTSKVTAAMAGGRTWLPSFLGGRNKVATTATGT